MSATSDLLEREGELAQCDVLACAARHGTGRLVVVEGGAGIGKTLLLAAVCGRARDAGMRVLRSRGGELEQEFPYGVARQLFEPVVAHSRQRPGDGLLGGAAALAAPLFGGDYLCDARAGAVESAFPTLHGLYWLTLNLAAQRPLALAVDDLHWADVPSLRWLAYLVRRLEGVPVLVVACMRPPDPGAEERGLTELLSEPTAFVVRPPPLSEVAVTSLVRAMLAADADSSFCAACFAATGGNPFLVRELLAELEGDGARATADEAPRVQAIGPRGVIRAIGVRLSRLPAPATALARAVAILGDDVRLEQAAALADLDRDAAVRAAGLLGAVELLRPGVPLSFAHPIVRASVYTTLSPIERDRCHARAAVILADSGATAEQVAAQLLLTAPRGEPFVVTALQRAAEQAAIHRAPDTAVVYLRRALEEPPPAEQRPEVLHRLGFAERQTLDAAAAGHLREALETTPDRHRHGETALELGRMLFFARGRGAEAIDILEHAIEQLPGTAGDLRRRLEAALLTIGLEEPSLYARVAPRLARLRAERVDDGVGGRALVAALAYHDARAEGPLDDCLARAEQALRGGRLHADEAGMAWCHAGFVLHAADRFDAALRVYDEVRASAAARGSVFTFSLSSLFRGIAGFLCGSLGAAEADLRLAIEAVESHGLGTTLPTPSAYLAETLIERGELAAAAGVLDRVAAGATLPDTVHLNSFRLSRARLRTLQGRPADALDELHALGRRYEAIGGRNPAVYSWRSPAVLALLELGDMTQARRLAADELQLARQWGAPRALGRALRLAGLAEGGDRGLALLGEATELLETSPAVLERTYALIELGAARRRSNRRAEAREPLRRGLELAHGCGARPLAARAHTELLATGARPRRLVLSGIDALTPSERRVASMAADGLTNRDIAQSLFVTPRTVEVHLSSAYRKLGIAARSQLRDALAAPVPRVAETSTPGLAPS